MPLWHPYFLHRYSCLYTLFRFAFIPPINDVGFPAHTVNFHPKSNLWVGYIIEYAGRWIYHAGDTDFIDEMRSLKNIDLALLPMGGTYTMDIDEGIAAAKSIDAKSVARSITACFWAMSVQMNLRKNSLVRSATHSYSPRRTDQRRYAPCCRQQLFRRKLERPRIARFKRIAHVAQILLFDAELF